MMDRDKDGMVHRTDAEDAKKKYKKTLSEAVANGIMKSFDDKNKADSYKSGMDYAAFCEVMNKLKVTKGQEKASSESKAEVDGGGGGGGIKRKPSKKKKWEEGK
jgi:Ca2+-binding EF-hand superfamily protein